ncbi:hypothetical protein [Actinoplanes sp. TFC3]|uniref:hypothetical protein n=1 Tax=Actinoplanes sp. TFC3 TaxID=1710355 RepID=UPI00082B87E7|nr:hypothetical protein [Actinoplanes sp. TFC3]
MTHLDMLTIKSTHTPPNTTASAADTTIGDLSSAVRAAYGTDPDCFNNDCLWTLADRTDTFNPATAPDREDIIRAALTLFVDAGLGPPDRADAWLTYRPANNHVVRPRPGPCR